MTRDETVCDIYAHHFPPIQMNLTKEEYISKVNAERQNITANGITNALYDLGYKIDTMLCKLIELCDKMEEENKTS